MREVERAMDEVNARNTYGGNGIIHKRDCPLLKLRLMVVKLEEETGWKTSASR